MKNSLLWFMLLFFMEGVFSEMLSVSSMEGDSVTLNPKLSEVKKDDVIDWRFGGALIARVRTNNIPSVYEDALDGTFSGRLQLNGQTGDLTITNITTTDAGDYDVSNSINTIQKTIGVSVLHLGPLKGKTLVTPVAKSSGAVSKAVGGVVLLVATAAALIAIG